METPEQKALRLGPIVAQILFHSNLKELKTSRLVNSIWCRVSSDRIREVDAFALHFSFNQTHEKYLKALSKIDQQILSIAEDASPYENRLTLQDLVNLLEERTHKNFKLPCFPVFDICFRGGDLTSPDLQRFLTLHGEKIKTLRIQHCDDAGKHFFHPQMKTINEIFTRQTPNLKILEFGHTKWRKDYPDHEVTFPSDWDNLTPLPLPYCEQLLCSSSYYNRDYYFPIANILLGAPRLQSTSKLGFSFLASDIHNNQQINKADIIRLVKSLKDLKVDLYMSDNEMVHKFLEFSQLNPKLESITLSQGIHMYEASHEAKRDFTTAMNLLLESCKDSLTSFKIKAIDILNLPGIHIPQMVNLTSLHLEDGYVGHEESSRFFNEDTNYRYSFPNLHHLFVLIRRDHEEEGDYSNSSFLLETRFPLAESLETVKELQLELELTPYLTKAFSRMMPSVKKLIIRPNSCEFREMMKSAWKLFVEVEELELQFYVEFIIPNLDSAFTGLSEETCHGLREMEVNERPARRMLTRKCGLPRMTKLKKLCIVYDSFQQRQLDLEDDELVTDVSHFYAFALIPGLGVTISYNQECPLSSHFMGEAFRTIAPYVKVKHVAFPYDD